MLNRIADKWDRWRRRRFGHYWIGDPRPIAASAPYTFYMPSENELLALAPGDEAKLMFVGDPPGTTFDTERMWVDITEIDGDHLSGKLDNDPSQLHQLRAGDLIRFERHQIIDIEWTRERTQRPPASPPHRQYWDRCLVDRCVLNENVPVYYLYREEPDDTGGDTYPDSGWRIRGDYRGLTDDEIDARDVEYVAIGVVLNEDDSWLHLIDAPTGSAFIRDGENNAFTPYERDQT